MSGIRVLLLGLLLASARQDPSLDALVEQLSDDRVERREAAVEALARLGPDRLPELRKRLEGLDPEPKGRLAAAILRIEDSVRVLEFLEGLLQEGAILLFDDWSCFGASDDHGERRALREFLAAHPRWTVEPLFAFGGHGQAFVVHADTQGRNERLDARGE